MSKVTTIVETIFEKLSETFPDKTRIPYAISLEDNNKRFLEKGYGFIVGSASFQEFEYCSRVSARSFSVVFTYEVPRTDSKFEIVDSYSIKLLEDVNTVQGLFYGYNELDIEPDILKVDIDSTSGVQEVLSGSSRFLSMQADFTFQIKEDL